MTDRTTRIQIRQLHELTGELQRRVERLEALVLELNPGVVLGPLDSGVVSPEALAAFEAGLIASVADYVPAGNNAVEGGEVVEEIPAEPGSGPETAGEVETAAPPQPADAGYAALHKGRGRWVVTKGGEVMEALVGDFDSDDDDSYYFTKAGAAERCEDLTMEDEVRAEQRQAAAVEAAQAADEAA